MTKRRPDQPAPTNLLSGLPQKANLPKIRSALSELDGRTTPRGAKTKSEARAENYEFVAARFLGWVGVGRPPTLTAAGRQFLQTVDGSQAEAAAVRKGLLANEALQLLGVTSLDRPPAVDDLIRPIREATGLKESTARRRAQTLRTLCGRAMTQQLAMTYAPPSDPIERRPSSMPVAAEPSSRPTRNRPALAKPARKSNMNAPLNLTIRNFAQIREVSLDLADLTVLVGVQGAGKSIALQWLKAALDGKHVMNALRDAGEHAEGPSEIIDLIFGDGMGSAWTSHSAVTLGGKPFTPEVLRRRGGVAENAFFVPAHRSMLIQDGWAAPFQRLSSDTPVVARMFSQNLFDRFSARRGGKLFPLDRLLKREYRDLVDKAVYHGGSIGLEQEAKHAKRLKMSHGGAQLPFMTWTAGQREFTPLLLGLYHVLTSRSARKREDIDWVIVEEPEMGLHPHAITVFLLLVLDLLWRGYRVVLSTHSPHVLTAMWMMQRLIQHKAKWHVLCHAFEVERSKAIEAVFKSALTKQYAVHALSFGKDGKVTAQDISNLDPESDDPYEAEWGGLTGFSSRFGDAVREAVNASGE